MTFEEYKKIAGQSILQAAYIYDLARSAEKITRHHTDPKNGEEGPFLVQPESAESDPRGYILRTSIELNAAINIYYSGDVTKSPRPIDGRLKLDLSMLPELDGSRVTPYVAKTGIIEQFELLKTYLVYLKIPHDVRAIRKAAGQHRQDLLDLLESLVRRRNELTHEILAKQPSMKEAVEYSYAPSGLPHSSETKWLSPVREFPWQVVDPKMASRATAGLLRVGQRALRHQSRAKQCRHRVRIAVAPIFVRGDAMQPRPGHYDRMSFSPGLPALMQVRAPRSR